MKTGGGPLALDLCTGRGGWARGLVKAGFRVVGVDILPRPDGYPEGAEYVQADIRDVRGADFAEAELGVGSPPCVGFTRLRHANPLLRHVRPRPLDFRLVMECLRIFEEVAEARGDDDLLWCIENVDGAIPFFQASLGFDEPTKNARPFYLYGRFPDFDLPEGPVKVKMGSRAISTQGKGLANGKDNRARVGVTPAAASEIPGALADPFAAACMMYLQRRAAA